MLGSNVGMPNSAMFGAYVPIAQLLINEVNPNIGSSRDLIEFLVVAPGTTNGITLVQRGSAVETLADAPGRERPRGRHHRSAPQRGGRRGRGPRLETIAKNQYPNATFGANYDGAWDFHGGNTGLSFSNRILEIQAPAACSVHGALRAQQLGEPARGVPGHVAGAPGGGELAACGLRRPALHVHVDAHRGGDLGGLPGLRQQRGGEFGAAEAGPKARR
ncbi:MAG: hypothetical protein R3B70_15340 [Polyangiaceae bacterium]